MRWLVAAFAVSCLAAGQAAADGDPQKGAKIFRQCMACHRIGPGATPLVGPPLNGIIGRKAGSVEGFKYSAPMIEAGAAGLVWDEANIAEYLRSPKAKIPGNKMAFPGLTKDQEIADVIAYLKADPKP